MLSAPKPPKPFSRASVDLDRVKKSWKATTAFNIQKGDMVRDYGMCVNRVEVQDVAKSIKLEFANGHSIMVSPSYSLFAFTEDTK